MSVLLCFLGFDGIKNRFDEILRFLLKLYDILLNNGRIFSIEKCLKLRDNNLLYHAYLSFSQFLKKVVITIGARNEPKEKN